MSDRHRGDIPCDRSELLGGALVHHGPVSDRAYLVKPGDDPIEDIAILEHLAAEYGYGKLFAKVLSGSREAFEDAGFVAEARVPLAHRGDELLFCSRFLDSARTAAAAEPDIELVLGESAAASASLGEGAEADPDCGLPPGLELGVAGPDDAGELAALYARVFKSYPFPIGSAEFVAGEMASGTVFAVAREARRIVAVASDEVDTATRTSEMTDFATAPDHRGKGLASALLRELEEAARARHVATAYTIARATSTGMNVVFARQGYSYGGLLVNNTGICGTIESMNVWYRTLFD